MINLILAGVLLLLALAGIAVRKTYYYLPLRELKRQAEKHDPLAEQLYRVAAYGGSLRGLLWLYIGLTSAASFILLARELPIWLSLLVVGPLLWIGFSLLPATKLSGFSARLTSIVTPAIAWLLNYLHPILGRSADHIERRYINPLHTKLFERDDLLDLIERQQQQSDSRITPEELEIIRRALTFGDHAVGDIMTPRKQVKTILAGETIGPILIDEVVKTGQDFVLVRDGKKGPVIGTLKVNMLSIHSAGKVSDLMDDTVYYLHESDDLSEALHAFFVTNHAMFVVVNSFEEFVGIISMETLLKQLLGHMPGSEFEQYGDLAAVAAKHSLKTQSEDDETNEEQSHKEAIEPKDDG